MRTPRFRQIRCIALVALMVTLALAFSACREDDDDKEASNEDKRQILCEKIDACGFADTLGVDDCETYAEDLSDWLLACALDADGCGELAECFNIAEGVTPDE